MPIPIMPFIPQTGFDGTGFPVPSSGPTKQNEKIIQSEADLLTYSTLVSGVAVLNPYDYYFDGYVIETSTPIAPPDYPPASGLGGGRLFGNGIIKYTGAGAFIRNNPNGNISAGMLIFNIAVEGDGTNNLFNLSNLVLGFVTLTTLFQNFSDLGTLKSNAVITFTQARFFNFANPLKLIDNDQVRLSQGLDSTGLLGGQPYYIISGSTAIISIGANPQVIFQNPSDSYLKLDPFLTASDIVVEGASLGPAQTSGQLYTSGLTSNPAAVALNNGSGFVRINNVTAHSLTNLASVRIGGPNDYRTKGYKAEVITASTFDLLADYNDILLFTDAGGGLITVKNDFKHRLQNGDSVVIASTFYNSTYTVSGVNPVTPTLFTITETFAGTSAGTYKKYTPFTTAGDGVRWYSGSLNETTVGVSSRNNGMEVDSTVNAVTKAVGVGTTALTTTYTPIISTWERRLVGQRITVYNDGKIYLDGDKRTLIKINAATYIKIAAGSATTIKLSYTKNGATTPPPEGTEVYVSLTNKLEGKDVGTSLIMDPGDYFQLVGATDIGTEDFTLNNSTLTITS